MKAKSNLHLLLILTIVVCLISINIFFPLIEASTGIMVALYFNPQSILWDSLIDLKRQYPNVNVLAVINPHNGPGDFKDTTYATEVLKLQSAGITVLGYTFTNYGQRGINLIFQDINKYTLWYNVDGIFFDEVANFGQENYYRGVSQYAKSQGVSYIVGNPGTNIPVSYIGIMDTYVIYENRGLPSLTYLANIYPDYDKRNFAITSYGIFNLPASDISSISNYVGYLSITDDDLPNPYNTYPSYLELIFATLSSQIVPPPSTLNPPIARDSEVTVDEDKLIQIQLDAFDPDINDKLTYSIKSQPNAGTIIDFGSLTGTLTYQPNQNFNGNDLFTFKAVDQSQLESNLATVHIIVNPVNDPPLANNQQLETNQNIPFDIILKGSDRIDNSDIISKFRIISSTTNGQISNFDSVKGTLTYTPNNNFIGQDSFTFKVADSLGLESSNTGQVSINVKSTQLLNNEQPPLPLPSSVCTDSNVNLKGTQDNDNLIGTSKKDVIRGFDGNDRFNGCDRDDKLFGNSGNDGIAGGPGSDYLYAGDGNDILEGNEGRDRFYCEGGYDKIIDFDYPLDVKTNDCEEFWNIII